MHFALNEDQIAVRAMARDFAAEKIPPHALRWDEQKHFPVEVMREAAKFGIGSVYIRYDVGGSGMSRWRAAAALDRKDFDATMLCAMAKRFGSDVGFEVADQARQLHGGYGYLSAYGVEKMVRDLRVHQILEGTNEIMRLIVARKMIERAR